MEFRARIRPLLRRAGLLAALSAFLVPAAPATAEAATAPVVKRVTPKRVFVGETMTIRGRHFRAGIGKNTVAFKRTGAKVVLVRAGKSTRKMMRVKLPTRLEKVLHVENGTRVVTRLRIRVMSTRFGRRYTSRAKSPLVGPEKPPAPPAPPVIDPDADCDGDGAINRVDADDDNDLLSDAGEAGLSKLLNTCAADTDGDGVEDGYEYQSASDLNDDEHQNANAYTPYPRKLPYPNPLDGQDGGSDHDGDDLTLVEEFKLWNYTIAAGAPRTLAGLTYSAGQQYSVSLQGGGARTPTLEYTNYDKHNAFLAWAQSAGYEFVRLSALTDAEWWNGGGLFNIRDFDRDGTVESAGRWDEATYYNHLEGTKLDDSERDEDADGLTNWAETRGCMQQGYWTALYKKETSYPLTYAGTRHDDPDTDGDGIRDGADDEDHDDIPNVMECSRYLAAEGGGPIVMDALDAMVPNADGRRREGWVNPFNPCLPYTRSRGCKQIVTVGAGWAPFSTKPGDIFFIHN